ncbi:nitrite reductase small subunit NirD [Marinomonas algicola]|uniref:nitrite reductase small subunit NirD n=1 Tax=Marinomonas algicola TaxID=2773454 RepID=UPI00174E951D|nr:nitrite reductase small subunit NirD [Marinomonas algicola]
MNWIQICTFDDLVAHAGIAARVTDSQVAIFFEPESNQLYALSNWDPIAKANVMSRGLIAEVDGRLTVASPLYKQRYCLVTGECLDDAVSLPVWNVKLDNNSVWIAPK